MTEQTKKTVKTVPASEEDQVARKLLVWLNTCPELPDDIDLIRFEFMPADTDGMAISTIQSAFKTREYILGGYEAEYQFKVIYRMKPGSSSDKRLQADELLNRVGVWAETVTPPDLADGQRACRVIQTARSSLFAAYENGDEDHQILMKLIYEINV